MAFFQPDVTDAGVRAGLDAVGGVSGLAKALAATPTWGDLGATAIVVREAPAPLIGLVGRFDEAAMARLRVLTWQLEHVLPRTMVLDHGAVGLAVDRLAATLSNRFGRAACASFRYTGLPRGGLIVLGLLAYALDLDQAQLATCEGDDRPLVVVDDTMISGNRLRRALDTLAPGRPIVAATLFAAPEARTAAEGDARVRAAVSAYDLRDDAERRMDGAYASWLARWRERDPHGYWIGRPQHVVFPWNEPDIGFWNDASGRTEPMWRLVAPDRCTKNRPRVGSEPVTVQEQPYGRGPLRPAADLLAARFEHRRVLGRVGWSACLVLEGSAADMWDALVAHGTPEAAAEALTAAYDAPVATLASDLSDIADALVERGALEVAAS